jgi:hypothetical protein
MSRKQTKSLKSWKGIFNEKVCFIIGCSPSILNVNLDQLREKYTIGINNVLPLIDPCFLFWQDYEFWQDHHIAIQKSKSIKVCSAKSDPLHLFFNFNIDSDVFSRTDNPAILRGKGSTGPLAVQFADALGFKKIYTLGVDCCVKKNHTDWYGENKRWKPYTLDMCLKGLEWFSSEFKDKIENINNDESLARIIGNSDSSIVSREEVSKMLY